MNCKLQRLVRTFISITPAILLTVAMGCIAVQAKHWAMWVIVVGMGAKTAWIGHWLFNNRPDTTSANLSEPNMADRRTVSGEHGGEP